MRGLSEADFFFAVPPVSLELNPSVEFSRLNPLAKSLCFSLRVRGAIYSADPLVLGHSAVLQYCDLVSVFSEACAGSSPKGALNPEYSSHGIIVASIAVPPAVRQRPSVSGKTSSSSAALLPHKHWSWPPCYHANGPLRAVQLRPSLYAYHDVTRKRALSAVRWWVIPTTKRCIIDTTPQIVGKHNGPGIHYGNA